MSDSGAHAGARARQELPTSIAELPRLGAAFETALDAGLDELGLRGGPADGAAARRSYEAHARLLAAWGAAINLTAICEPAAVALRHVCDSLSAVPHLSMRLAGAGSLLDLGSGAGYPGLPLAATLPLARVALVESVGKKARFLSVAAAAVSEALGDAGAAAQTIEVRPERAEDLAEDPEHRGAWQIVTARAVGALAEVAELGLPLLRQGGWLVAWKRDPEVGSLGAELRDAGPILRLAGGGRPEVVRITAPSLPGHRLVIVRKERATPAAYPRPAGARRRRA
jgi:16S rRNA (guanine527-N7)-methyltransferase